MSYQVAQLDGVTEKKNKSLIIPEIRISETSSNKNPEENKLDVKSNTTYNPAGRKNDEFLTKQIVKIRYPSKEGDLASLTRRKIETNLFSYDLISNFESLNRDIIENRIDCSICYSLIFYHESISDRLGPLAYQCSMCWVEESVKWHDQAGCSCC